ncbi:MAG: DNA polymerase III subunit gamma/tau [Chloroflexaceae bacterium]|nr:DNA polymerase III subunit gamma/tau [Chloroflexaceae bacterium]
MASQALYRKWRSQTFEHIIGQEHVVQTLRHALAEERVAHAYLFTGPRGVGKTSMARLLAKAVNCTAPVRERPCGTCESCCAIAENRAVDVIEMDAASHTSVDDAREMIERVQFRPTSGRSKVYIIDEVHMLSTAAFNALLKTLEEPPDHAIFILATTEVHKVPATILSRCQRFTFMRHTIASTAGHLHHIAAEEHLTLEPGVAEAVARAATGSLRDALGILEQLSSFSTGAITLDQVHHLLGMTSAAEVHHLIEALLSGDLASALRAVNHVADQGADMRQFTRDVIERLRALLLLVATSDQALLDVSEEEVGLLREWSRRADLGTVKHWIQILSTLDYQLRTSPYGHLPLELAVVEALISPAQTRTVGFPSPALRPPAPTSSPHPPPSSSRPPQPADTPHGSAAAPRLPPPAPPPADHAPGAWSAPEKEKDEKWEKRETAREARGEEEQEREQDEYEEQHSSAEVSILEQVKHHWPAVIRDVRPHDPTLQALLRSAQPVEVEGRTVILLASSEFHRERISEPRYLQIVQKVLSETLGATFQVRCTAEKRPERERVRHQIDTIRREDALIDKAVKIFRAEVVGIESPENKED